MTIGQTFAAELQNELVATRKLIALLPDAKAGWQPHAKSMTAGGLALHLAGITGMASQIVSAAELDFSPPGGPPWTPPVFTSVAAILAELDLHGAKAVAALNAASDAAMQEAWSLKNGGVVIFTMPRAQAIRIVTLNHAIHHRGQLDVYLRLLDIPLPQVYGPSADAPM
jgi:uncharacterized damage-inducible protein DinB